MLTMMLTVLAAQALAAVPPPSSATPPVTETAPETTVIGRPGFRQVFIAPSGEPFRVAEDAPYPVVDWFAGADANKDGKLTASEFTADFLRFFATLDLDQDGVIDSGELERYELDTPELRTAFVGRFDTGTVGADGQKRARRVGSYMDANSPQGAGRYDLLGIPQPVASMDTTLKGRINREQARDAADYRFSLLDIRHKGYLMLVDLPRTYAQKNRGEIKRRGRY